MASPIRPFLLLLTLARVSVSLSSASLRRRSSSAVFPLYGNVYPDGIFFVALSIGDPPKPYFLDVDTGSELSWLQCDAPCINCSKGPHPLYKPTKNKLVKCGHPLCSALSARNPKVCASTEEQCDYEVEYADYGSSRGVLVRDAFSIRFINGSLLRPDLVFGCGYDQELHGESSPTDGVLGLGRGESSVLAQLKKNGLVKNVLGHCMGRSGGGFLFFGDGLVPKSSISWVPIMGRNHYSPGPADLFLSARLIYMGLNLIFDSGSSYTYFSSEIYEALILMVKEELAAAPLKEITGESALPVCWSGTRAFRSFDEAVKFFKPLTLSFSKKARFEILPSGYLILTKLGNVCLGILNGTQVGLRDVNVIGDISMLGLVVVYDNERGRIGWARADCNRLPNEDTNEGYEDGFTWSELMEGGAFERDY